MALIAAGVSVALAAFVLVPGGARRAIPTSNRSMRDAGHAAGDGWVPQEAWGQ